MAFYLVFWKMLIQNAGFPVRQHKVVVSRREPDILRVWPGQFSQSPQPGETRAQGCAEGQGQELLAVLQMSFRPHLPADYNMLLKPNQISLVFALMQFSV